MSRGFFNPSVPFQQPPPNAEVNWAMLAQRWMSEHGNNEYQNPGNYRNQSFPPQNQQQQYGNFFMAPSPAIHNRPPLFPQAGFPPRLPPSGPSGFNQPQIYGPAPPPINQMPPVPLSSYGNPYALDSWTNTVGNDTGNNVPRPLFQSHAHEATKSNIPTKYSPNEEESDIPQGAMPHWLNGVDVDDPTVMNWMNASDWSGYDPNAVIDQQARKKLPAWLLEGLEKAEMEKKRNEEKSKKMTNLELENQQREQRRKQKGLGKFDSDSESENEDASTSTKQESIPQIGRKRKSREIDEREYKENQMSAIKRLVTLVLLESTDSAINELFHRVVSKARSTAKPQIISKTNALTSLTSIVGYDDSDESSDEEE